MVTGGLTGYKRRRSLSLLDPEDRKYRSLHKNRKYNEKGRRIGKLLSKNNWYKRKNEDIDDMDDTTSPKKRTKEGGDSPDVEEISKDSSKG